MLYSAQQSQLKSLKNNPCCLRSRDSAVLDVLQGPYYRFLDSASAIYFFFEHANEALNARRLY